MPRIVRTGGVIVSDDVVKIRDVSPSPAVRPKPRPHPAEDGEALEGMSPEMLADLDGNEALDTEAEFAPMSQQAPSQGQYGGYDGTGQIQEEIVQSAMAQAGRILEDAIQQAQQEKQQLLSTVDAEAQQIRQQAAEQGRQEGFAQVGGQVQSIADSLENTVARFEGERAGFEAEYEEQLRWLAVEIAGKVLAQKVAEDDAVLTEMVNKAMQSVRNEQWVRVEVSQEMTHLLDNLVALFQDADNVEVSAIPAAPGTIQIETPSGMVDASLKTQLENLKEYFLQK